VRRYFPFLIVLFLIAALLRVDFFFTVGYLFFLMYVLGRFWIGRGLKGIRAERVFTDRAFAGDEVAVRVEVRNTSRLPVPWLHVHESLPVDLISPPFHREVFSLKAGEARHFDYTLYCRRRGVYRLGPLAAESGDLLGLEPQQQFEFPAGRLIVYPQVVHLTRLRLPTRSPLVALPAQTPLFEDTARVTGVRDYQRGDSPRRIHWTATATAGRLLVKQYQPAISRETLVVLDLNGGSYESRRRIDASELAIVTAASLLHHIIVRERLPAGLATEALDAASGQRQRFHLPARRERGHLMNLLETLARAQLAPALPLAALLRAEQPRLPWGATLIAITGLLEQDLFDSLGLLRRAGFAVALVAVQATVTPADEAQAALLGVPLRQVWRERDLEQWA
jgi:uncharacterized protein (DUF58 family)